MVCCEENFMTRSAAFLVMSGLAKRGKKMVISSKGAEPLRNIPNFVMRAEPL